MSETTVKRLARKWASETGESYEEYVTEADARWWLRAIAAEVERVDLKTAWRFADWLHKEADDE